MMTQGNGSSSQVMHRRIQPQLRQGELQQMAICTLHHKPLGTKANCTCARSDQYLRAWLVWGLHGRLYWEMGPG